MSPPRPREVAALDIARLFAAQAVMVYHLAFLSWAEPERSRGIRAVVGRTVQFPGAVEWAGLGWIGVPVFFVISGFVILMSAQRQSTGGFIIGRLVRVAPGLWCLSAVSALLLVATGVLAPMEAVPRLLRSVVLFPVGPWVDGAVWTLVAEAIFYAFVAWMIRTGRIDRPLPVLAAVSAGNIVFWCVVLAAEAGFPEQAARNLTALASSYRLRVTLVTANCYFVLGAALYGLFRRREVRAHATVFAVNFAVGLVATYHAALSSVAVSEFGRSPLAAVVVWGVATLVIAACVLLRAGTGPRLARLATMAGLLTYPLYLINQITGGFLLGLGYRLGLPPVVAVIVAGGLCTVLAGLFAGLIEAPLQRVLRRWLVALLPAPRSPCVASGDRSMRIHVAIATVGRPDHVCRTVDLMAGQQRPPDGIVVVAVSRADVEGIDRVRGHATVLLTERGLCRQRNRALAVLRDCADVVVFLDDDFVPAADYLARVEALFAAEPGVVGITGVLLADGVRQGGITPEDAGSLLDWQRPGTGTGALESRPALYGCNMAIRMVAARDLQFDENLPLYGWQEDVDFTVRLGRRGRLVCAAEVTGVHLGVRGGRTSGLRLGYSQVANVIYLERKGTMGAAFAMRLVTRNLMANLLGSILAPGGHVDRRGRLRGNLMALADGLRGRIDPRRILEM